MKFPLRTDVTTNKRATFCGNSTCIGYSTNNAKYGDFLLVDTNTGPAMARYHGRVLEPDGAEWMLIQQGDTMRDFTMERWITPESVLEVRAPEHMAPELVAFFDRTFLQIGE